MIGGGIMPCCWPLFISFCVPFLLCWPGWASLVVTRSTANADLLWLLFPTGGCLVGTAGYAVAAYLMMSSAIKHFDRRSGRTEKYPLLRPVVRKIQPIPALLVPDESPQGPVDPSPRETA